MYTSHTYRTVGKLVQLLNRRFNPRLRKTSRAAPQATRVSQSPEVTYRMIDSGASYAPKKYTFGPKYTIVYFREKYTF